MSGEDRTIECDGCGEAFGVEAARSYLREATSEGELLTVCRHRTQCEIDAVIATFPPHFSLRGFPRDRFRISPSSSFESEKGIQLYVYRQVGDEWLAFSKGSAVELRHEIREVIP